MFSLHVKERVSKHGKNGAEGRWGRDLELEEETYNQTCHVYACMHICFSTYPYPLH